MKRAAGQPLGRPKGRKATRVKLDAKEAEIRVYLALGSVRPKVAFLSPKVNMARFLPLRPSKHVLWVVS